MLQSTSLAAFREITPTLGKRQIHVLECFADGKDYTNSEIAERLGWSINRVTPRIFELRKRESPLLVERLKRPCRVTGRTAIAWVATRPAPRPDAYTAETLAARERKEKVMSLFR